MKNIDKLINNVLNEALMTREETDGHFNIMKSLELEVYSHIGNVEVEITKENEDTRLFYSKDSLSVTVYYIARMRCLHVTYNNVVRLYGGEYEVIRLAWQVEVPYYAIAYKDGQV